jgi:hypothetical protein
MQDQSIAASTWNADGKVTGQYLPALSPLMRAGRARLTALAAQQSVRAA